MMITAETLGSFIIGFLFVDNIMKRIKIKKINHELQFQKTVNEALEEKTNRYHAKLIAQSVGQYMKAFYDRHETKA